MDNLNQDSNRPVNSRRKQRSQMQIFKEAYLPTIIAGVAILLIIIFIIGSISRAVQRNKAEQAASIAASEASAAEYARLEKEANRIAKSAARLAAQYDYEGAITLINSFEGTVSDFPALSEKLTEFQQAQSELVAWDDIGQIPNLSFHLLIADPSRAYTNKSYGASYNRNFVTTEEFSAILQQLYDNGYVLVTPKDFVATEQTPDGKTIHTTKPIYLPSNKKPIVLTETQVNYYTYMVDSDDADKLPDQNGAGFAYRLGLDIAGEFVCEMITATGETVTGPYDFVPILELFIRNNPDFSYRGARAVLALTGYDGLFGYRNESVADAKPVIDALKSRGYELACYTYNNEAYGDMSASGIKSDLAKWQQKVEPILGKVDIFVFAQQSDISNSKTYSGEKYNLLHDAGFRIYLGFCDDGAPLATVAGEYVRMGRLLVTGSNMAYHASWFNGMFDAKSVLDPSRGQVPR